MKIVIVLLIGLGLGSSSLQAQITQSVWPEIHDTVILGVDTNMHIIDYNLVNQSGENLTWNLPALASHTVDTLIALNPIETPSFGSFPNSNYVLHSSLSSSATFEWGYIYYNKTDSAIYKEGGTRHINSTGFLVDLFYSHPITEMKYPFELGMAYGDTIHIDGELLCAEAGFQSTDSCFYDGGIARFDTLDATGTLNIGGQTFLDTYRVRRSERHIDTFYISTNEIEVWDTLYFREVIKEYHTWYDTGDMFILELIFDENFNNRLNRYSDRVTGLATGQSKPEPGALKVDAFFNSESSLELHIDSQYDDDYELIVSDVLGNRLIQQTGSLNNGSQRIRMESVFERQILFISFSSKYQGSVFRRILSPN